MQPGWTTIEQLTSGRPLVLPYSASLLEDGRIQSRGLQLLQYTRFKECQFYSIFSFFLGICAGGCRQAVELRFMISELLWASFLPFRISMWRLMVRAFRKVYQSTLVNDFADSIIGNGCKNPTSLWAREPSFISELDMNTHFQESASRSMASP